MKTRKTILSADASEIRLDAFLALRLKRYSRSYLKDLIQRSFVLVEGKSRGADFMLKGGEKIEVAFPEPAWESGAADFKSWIVHEDRALLVLAKPAGLLMHPLSPTWLDVPAAALSEPQPNLAGILQRERPDLREVPRCGIVHRLDRQTSGVLLVAKTLQAQERLVEEFQRREVEKIYRAVVCGAPATKESSIDAPVGRNPGHRRVVVTPFGKTAKTGVTVLEACAMGALVEARPLTGRTHQIRAHLAYLGYPVAGDPEFRPKVPLPEELRPARTMLHARRITFLHPSTGKKAVFKVEPPRDFRDFWKRCLAFRAGDDSRS